MHTFTQNCIEGPRVSYCTERVSNIYTLGSSVFDKTIRNKKKKEIKPYINFGLWISVCITQRRGGGYHRLMPYGNFSRKNEWIYQYIALQHATIVVVFNVKNTQNSHAVVTPAESPKSVRNRFVIEAFGGVFVLSIGWIFCWYRGFRHRTEPDLFLFLLVY